MLVFVIIIEKILTSNTYQISIGQLKIINDG